ncbi:hypothetical protein D3C81_1593780 [compost metagenome]
MRLAGFGHAELYVHVVLVVEALDIHARFVLYLLDEVIDALPTLQAKQLVNLRDHIPVREVDLG